MWNFPGRVGEGDAPDAPSWHMTVGGQVSADAAGKAKRKFLIITFIFHNHYIGHMTGTYSSENNRFSS